MIPKKIHYCWFGGSELPERDRKCIESWKRFCPDYEIIRWDESNYDVGKNRYMREAYETKKWGFVSDYARLDIIYEHGGIYLDTDVELIRNIDDLLENRAYMGFEQDGQMVATGLGFGAEKYMPIIREIRDSIYEDRSFKVGPNEYDTTPCPAMNTTFLEAMGLERNNRMQTIGGITIYPSQYFAPLNSINGILEQTDATYSIHHYHASWLEPEEKIIFSQSQRLISKYGEKAGGFLSTVLSKPYRIKMHLRTKGLSGTVSFVLKKLMLLSKEK